MTAAVAPPRSAPRSHCCSLAAEPKPAPSESSAARPARGAAAGSTEALPSYELIHEVRVLRSLVEGQLAGFAFNDLKRRDPAKADVLRRLVAAGFGAPLARELVARAARRSRRRARVAADQEHAAAAAASGRRDAGRWSSRAGCSRWSAPPASARPPPWPSSPRNARSSAGPGRSRWSPPTPIASAQWTSCASTARSWACRCSRSAMKPTCARRLPSCACATSC